MARPRVLVVGLDGLEITLAERLMAAGAMPALARLRAGLFGSKLTLRLVLLFSLVAVLPGALVYSVSVQFLNKSIESWFDVRVEKALEGGLSLGRTTLDNMLRELNAKADSMALKVADVRPSQLLPELDAMREQAGVREATLFQPDGSIMAFSISEGAGLMPSLLPARAMHSLSTCTPTRRLVTGSNAAWLPPKASYLSSCTRVMTCISPCAPTGL